VKKKKMNTKNVMLGMAIATVFLVAAVGSASALPDCPAPGNTVITESCELNQNYNVPTGHGYIIGADDITIDGKGHTITGDGCTAAPTIGIYNFDTSHGAFGCGYNNTIIKNLEVKNFCIGIRTGGDYNPYSGQCLLHVTNNTIDNCTVHDNGNPAYAGDSSLGIDLWPCASYNTIKNCEVYNTTGAVSTPPCESGGIAIRLKVASSHNTITDNTVHNNKGPAVLSKAWCTHNRITHNNFYENGEESYTGPTGGIVLRCYKTHSWTIDNNTITDNYGPGIWVGGGWNTIRDNVITGNKNRPSGDIKDGNGISICRCGEGGEGGMNSVIKDNTLCDNENKDIFVLASGYNNTGDENTCDTTWNYDDDGTTGCTYSCFKINGSASKDGNPVDLDKVDISNREYTDKEWTATIDGDYYESFIGARKGPGGLDPDISPNEELLIVGCEEISTHEYNCNVTNHMVVQADIDNGGITKDLTLNHYCLNYYPDYPYYTQEEDNWSGPAVMKACIGHYITPPSQAVLNTTGIANNDPRHAGLLYVDPEGMETTMDYYLHPIGRNYGVFAISDVEDALHRICYWHKLGPGAVPAYGDYSNWLAVRGIHTNKTPTDYSAPYNYEVYGLWVNDPKDPGGIGENSYKTATEFTTDYYILTDDEPVPEWNDKYMSILEPPEHDADITIVAAKPRLAEAITPELMAKPMMLYGVKQLALEKVVKDDESLKIVKAAIDGVNEELVPYDAEFAAVFAKTVPGKPMLVSSENGDYYVVPFNVPVEIKPIKKMPVEIERPKISGLKKLERMKCVADRIERKPIPIEPIRAEKTLVVVLVNAADGSFKEASWVKGPVKYLPVSKIEALKLAVGEVLDELHVVAKKDARDLEVIQQRPTIELVYTDASPYYPDWKVTVNGKVFYVSQDGTVSN